MLIINEGEMRCLAGRYYQFFANENCVSATPNIVHGAQ
ncbi:MAG: hypothetical protein ACI8ZT_002488, partial [Bacteroidia bacterium]